MTSGVRKRRAYRTALRRIEELKAEIFLALIAGDYDRAADAHARLVDAEHELRLIDTVRKYARKVAAE